MAGCLDMGHCLRVSRTERGVARGMTTPCRRDDCCCADAAARRCLSTLVPAGAWPGCTGSYGTLSRLVGYTGGSGLLVRWVRQLVTVASLSSSSMQRPQSCLLCKSCSQTSTAPSVCEAKLARIARSFSTKAPLSDQEAGRSQSRYEQKGKPSETQPMEEGEA